jgi:hypothetical protein
MQTFKLYVITVRRPSTPDDGLTRAKIKTKLRGLSPQANYNDRATATCRRG